MTDPSGHLDLDALADVLAGERDDPAHLRSCRACAARLAELSAADASTAAALAALPVPPLPDGLSLRLERALQQERVGRTAAVRPLRRRSPTWLPAVAASAALVMAGAVGWSVLDLTPGAGEDASTSADAGADTSGGGGGQETASEAAPEAAAGLALPGTGTDWSDDAQLPAALERLLAAEDRSADSDLAAPSGDGLDRLREPSALAGCLTALPGGDDDVLALDHGRYAGAPALAVVQPDGTAHVRVTVVAGGCSAADPQVLRELRLPRP